MRHKARIWLSVAFVVVKIRVSGGQVCNFCPPGQYSTVDCTASTNRTCVACPAGNFCPGSRACEVCKDNVPRTCCPYDGDQEGYVPCTPCTSNFYQTAACSASENYKCAACATRTSNNACESMDQILTNRWNMNCYRGTWVSSGNYIGNINFWNKRIGTPYSNVHGHNIARLKIKFLSMPVFTSPDNSLAVSMYGWNSMKWGWDVNTPFQRWSDGATWGTRLPTVGFEYVFEAPSEATGFLIMGWGSQDQFNFNFSVDVFCGTENTYMSTPCGSGSPGVCSPCSSATCASNQYLSSTCSATTNNVCGACPANNFCNGVSATPCAATCVAGTYKSTGCTSSTDRVCTGCEPNFYCTGGAARVGCTAACASNQYETSACTSTTNRVCGACPANSFCNGVSATGCTAVCAAGTRETTACTSTTDRVCGSCPAGSACTGGTAITGCVAGTSYSLGGASACSTCTATCTATTYETLACTTTQNRQCTTCPPGSACPGGTSITSCRRRSVQGTGTRCAAASG
jgi:hypothetical protein